MRLTVILLTTMAFCWDGFAQSTAQDVAKAKENTKLNLKFTSMDGRKVDLAAMKGKVILVDCWASWCGPCLKEMPRIKEMYDQYKAQGFEVIGVCLDEAKMKKPDADFLKRHRITWPQRFEGAGFYKDSFTKAQDIKALPTVFLIDKDGMIVDRNARGERLEGLIKKYLGL
jgi:thiol-disulfide isomerase/thioredoxin